MDVSKHISKINLFKKNKKKLQKKARSPFILLICGFAFLIFLGSLLFMLPFAIVEGKSISYVDSLFLSTSAVCVTGLVSTKESVAGLLTPFGYTVLWFLVEIGGLGFITLVTFGFSLTKKKTNMQTNLIIKEAMNQDTYESLIPLARKIVITSFSIQGIGIILTLISLLIEGYPIDKALGYSIFHAASSFNNAGFDLFGSNSLILLKDNILFMITTCLLIIFGGLGFVVMFDIIEKRRYSKLNVHSKIVLKTTFLILLIGTLALKITNWNEISFADSLYQIIFARTAGFASIDLTTLKNTGILILCVVMFIGGSPASIAGGIKTTTVYTIIKSIICFGKGKKHLIAYKREIKNDSILKSYVLVTVAFLFICIMTLILSIIEPTLGVKELFFEVVSAFATCGTSLSLTPNLSSFAKLIIVVVMYFGRLGPITFVSLLTKGASNEEELIKYVEEKIIIG